ncbi:MAG: hypothetical protein MZV70_50585 [Desulfobacterales bacterium]|nr:hypothetical protein [Desulfobacterales bacterium]
MRIWGSWSASVCADGAAPAGDRRRRATAGGRAGSGRCMAVPVKIRGKVFGVLTAAIAAGAAQSSPKKTSSISPSPPRAPASAIENAGALRKPLRKPVRHSLRFRQRAGGPGPLHAAALQPGHRDRPGPGPGAADARPRS